MIRDDIIIIMMSNRSMTENLLLQMNAMPSSAYPVERFILMAYKNISQIEEHFCKAVGGACPPRPRRSGTPHTRVRSKNYCLRHSALLSIKINFDNAAMTNEFMTTMLLYNNKVSF